MNIFKRAYLYIIRKKVRSILMLVIMFTMALFMLVSLSIRTSARQAAEDIRKSLTTGLILVEKKNHPSGLFGTEAPADGKVKRYLTAPLLTHSKLDQLAALEGVSGYFTEQGQEILYTGLEVQPGGYAESLDYLDELDPESGNPEYDQDRLSTDRAIHSNGFLLIEDGRWHPFFVNGALELTEGRHIQYGDIGKAVISEDLAGWNNLGIGDTIESYNYDFVSGEVFGSAFQSEIIGIFKINFEQDLSVWTAESNIFTNIIFADPQMRSWSSIEYNTHYGRNIVIPEDDRVIWSVTLFVEDPLLLDQVAEQVRKIEGVDWDYYEFKNYDHDYKAAAAPLRTMVGLSTALLIILSVGSLVILSLLLTMWIRSRKKEIGILATLGIRKNTTLLQFLLECSLIAAAAFLLAFAAAPPVTGAVGNAVVQMTDNSDSKEPYEVVFDNQSNPSINKTAAEEVVLEYKVTPPIALVVFLIMLTVTVLSVLAASLRILRQKPYDIIRGR